jgi:ElaA protein
MFQFKTKFFNELSIREFHDIVAIRIQSFVVEQDCPYQDLDGKDLNAYHVLGTNNNGEIMATARILLPGVSYPEISIGRVVVSPQYRLKNVGTILMQECLRFIEEQLGKQPIRISAQAHLEKFYNSLGFRSSGKIYLEDGIPHIEMLRNFPNNNFQ